MMTTRPWTPVGLASAMVLCLGACSEPTTPSAPTELGRLIARGSLTVVDGNQVPCCTVTTSGVRVTVLGGALSLYALAHYSDTVATPGGLMSGACVQELPNGSSVSLNGLVTLPDGSSYLLLPCSVGTYRLTLTEQTVFPDGSSQVNDTLLVSGSFTWHRDRLTLLDFKVRSVTAALSGASVAVVVPGHHYQFEATTIH
jgi:hypothetical protein